MLGMLSHTKSDEPQELGDYLLLRRVSDSYFGSRFLAHREDAPLPVLLTVIETPDGGLRQRLALAANVCRRREHALIAPAQYVESGDGALLIATPFRPGATIRELLDAMQGRGEAVPVDIALCIALDALEAARAVAEAASDITGVRTAHGGMHPDVLHVGLDGHTRLLDAGVAAAAAAEPRFSESTVRIAYASPENSEASSGLDGGSDVFSLGVILWEMMSCQPLFEGADPHELRTHLLGAPIPRIRRERFVRGEPVPAALADLVARSLQRTRGERYPDFAALAHALRESGPVASRDEVGAFIEYALGSLLIREHEVSAIVPITAREVPEGVPPTRQHRSLFPTDPALPADNAQLVLAEAVPEDVEDGVRTAEPRDRPGAAGRRVSGLAMAGALLALLAAFALYRFTAPSAPNAPIVHARPAPPASPPPAGDPVPVAPAPESDVVPPAALPGAAQQGLAASERSAATIGTAEPGAPEESSSVGRGRAGSAGSRELRFRPRPRKRPTKRVFIPEDI